jgi:hypothetical protein
MQGRKLLILQAPGVAVIGLLIFIGAVSAQSVPGLKPPPPKKARPAVTVEAHALAAPLAALAGTWQMLPNQPPVLDYFDCGPGSEYRVCEAQSSGSAQVGGNGSAQDLSARSRASRP